MLKLERNRYWESLRFLVLEPEQLKHFNNLSPKNFLQPDLAVDKVFARHPLNLCAEQSHIHCVEMLSYKQWITEAHINGTKMLGLPHE
jgi:hypothetical protein